MLIFLNIILLVTLLIDERTQADETLTEKIKQILEYIKIGG